MKTFRKAPLPFIGQKRNVIRHFEYILNQQIADDGAGWTIVDVFGGSGLLAHVAKRLKPQAHVIYNDYDNYAERLSHIDDTNRLRSVLLQIIGDTPKNQRLSAEMRTDIIAAIHAFDGYKDYITIATWLLFSGNTVKSGGDGMNKKTFWNHFNKNDYEHADDYLHGLEVVTCCFSELMTDCQQNKTLWILDPPYLLTEQGNYKKETYFNLIDFAKMMRMIKPPFILFSSTLSEMPKYIEFMLEYKENNHESFVGAEKIEFAAAVNYNKRYQDNIIYKF